MSTFWICVGVPQYLVCQGTPIKILIRWGVSFLNLGGRTSISQKFWYNHLNCILIWSTFWIWVGVPYIFHFSSGRTWAYQSNSNHMRYLLVEFGWAYPNFIIFEVGVPGRTWAYLGVLGVPGRTWVFLNRITPIFLHDRSNHCKITFWNYLMAICSDKSR